MRTHIALYCMEFRENIHPNYHIEDTIKSIDKNGRVQLPTAKQRPAFAVELGSVTSYKEKLRRKQRQPPK